MVVKKWDRHAWEPADMKTLYERLEGEGYETTWEFDGLSKKPIGFMASGDDLCCEFRLRNAHLWTLGGWRSEWTERDSGLEKIAYEFYSHRLTKYDVKKMAIGAACLVAMGLMGAAVVYFG